jgi:hypothetical protein
MLRIRIKIRRRLRIRIKIKTELWTSKGCDKDDKDEIMMR